MKYIGKRLSGGVKEYSDDLIEACLLIKIYMKLGYRQTQGFITSIFKLKNMTHKIPNYTPLCRRSKHLEVYLNVNSERLKNKPLVIAVASTGLSLRTGDKWNRYKHSPNKLPVTNIGSVCGDMDYDTFDCRKRMTQMKINQLIPLRKTAISYFEANKINGSIKMARKNWKK